MASNPLSIYMDPVLDSKHRYTIMNTVVFPIPPKINHHRSLATEITSLYGREIWNHVRLLEKLRVKIMKRAEDLNFLKTCRDKKLIPSFDVINHRMRNSCNQKSFVKLSLTLVRTEIKRTCTSLDRLYRDALSLHLKLSATISLKL